MQTRKNPVLWYFRLLTGFVVLFSLTRTNGSVQALASVFVTPAGTGDCTQANPCNLSSGLASVDAGGSLYATAGTYTGVGDQVVLLDKTINFFGGWSGNTVDDPVRDPAVYESILDGQNARRVITITGSSSVQPVVDGWTIQNGNASGLDLVNCKTAWGTPAGCGGGIHVYEAQPTITQNLIRNNNAAINGASSAGGGGGIYVYRSESVVIRSNKIHSNDAHINGYGSGGGILISWVVGGTVEISDNDIYTNEDDSTITYNHDGNGIAVFEIYGSVVIKNNRIHDNNPDDWSFWGNGISFHGCNNSVVVENNQILNNTGAGAVYFFRAVPVIRANTIINPESVYGILIVGVYPYGGTGSIVNNFIARHEIDNIFISGMEGIYPVSIIHNTISDADYGIRINDNANVTFDAGIISNHSISGIYKRSDPTITLNVANTLFFENLSDGITGSNPLFGDPLFVSPAGYDYHVRWGSAAIDRLPLDGISPVDIAGDSRPMGSGTTPYDVGADEFWWKIYSPILIKP